MQYSPLKKPFQPSSFVIQKMFDKEKAKIVALRAKSPLERRKCRTGFLGLYGPLMDPLDYHNQQLEELYEQIRKHQSDIYNRKEVSV